MLGVASATPDVGKSFISANLAAAMSRDPRFQTYLLDLDLRRGTIRHIFDISPESSLVDYLEGAAPAEDTSRLCPEGAGPDHHPERGG